MNISPANPQDVNRDAQAGPICSLSIKALSGLSSTRGSSKVSLLGVVRME